MGAVSPDSRIWAKNGQLIVEVKTGNGALTGNQANVYPAVQAGNAIGVGQNAQNAFGIQSGGALPSMPVIILQKK